MKNFYQRIATVDDYRLTLHIPFDKSEQATYNLTYFQGDSRYPLEKGTVAHPDIEYFVYMFFLNHQKDNSTPRTDAVRYYTHQMFTKYKLKDATALIRLTNMVDGKREVQKEKRVGVMQIGERFDTFINICANQSTI